jgi:hypothetical protein
MFNVLKLFTRKNKKFRAKKISKTQTKKIYGKTNEELCEKYKNKSVRETPKMCKKLPPPGWNMYKYFCD